MEHNNNFFFIAQKNTNLYIKYQLVHTYSRVKEILYLLFQIRNGGIEMIKNNRAYTNENGYIDDELITDLKQNQMLKVGNWIKENVISSDEVFDRASSYGLKHELERDIKIYLTNNQFKDAMLLAGYKPVDPNELNWRYKIELVKAMNKNPNPFYRWAFKTHGMDKSDIGDFARDMRWNYDFPVLADYDHMKAYLIDVNACDTAIQSFENLWKEYTNA